MRRLIYKATIPVKNTPCKYIIFKLCMISLALIRTCSNNLHIRLKYLSRSIFYEPVEPQLT